MTRLLRWYGAGPAHLLAMVVSFAVAAYAAVQLLTGRTLAIALWFIGAALLHDLVFLPLYSGADLTAQTVLPPRKDRAPKRTWVNYVRIPVALSCLLLLVWFPLILRQAQPYHGDTALSPDVYLTRWLVITAVLLAASAALFALRQLRAPARHAVVLASSALGHLCYRASQRRARYQSRPGRSKRDGQ
ncbi:hypothetical protein [Streptomyces sp. NPDC051286]|uniref:hypothetical protein n=1 Tax=Streptomyces sp. NPDC051286 TaxID=3365647 RepID=UPI0037B8F110